MSNQRISVAQQLYDKLNTLINSVEPGTRLPSEPKLAANFGVSRASLREAMRTFETQGILRRRQGAGTYVMKPPAIIESGLEVLESIETLAKRIGLEVSMGALDIQQREGNKEEIEALSLENHSKIVQISRTILAQDKPVAFLIDVLPEDVLSPLDVGNDFRGSVLDVLLRLGSPLDSSRCEISAVTASTTIAHAFGIQRGDVLLLFRAWLYSVSGRVVDYSFSYFLPGYFRFHVIRRVGQ